MINIWVADDNLFLFQIAPELIDGWVLMVLATPSSLHRKLLVAVGSKADLPGYLLGF